MRLNWFSPIPPTRSGIADYTQQVLPALTAAAETVIWTEQESWDAAVEDYAEVRTYRLKEMPWAEINRADMSLFHIGNNHRFHGAIWQVSQRHAGIVVLHDVALQQFFAGLYREQQHDRTGYLELMEHCYGSAGRQDAEDFWAGRLTIEYMTEQYRLTRHVMSYALGALVHSQRSFDELKHDSPCPLHYARLPYPAAPCGAHQQDSTGKPLSKGSPYIIIIFGHISDNRRLGSVLRALAGIPARERFRLEVYGELWDPQIVRRDVEDLGLEKMVTLHGFVPTDELEVALASAHLAINLRFPTMGEASVSQLQVWHHALPSLVTRVGWYATLPETTVAFVRPEHEIADIQAHLRAFLGDPGRYAHMGEEGRRYLRAHHIPEAYVQGIIAAVMDAEAFRPHAIAHDMARRIGQEMRRWTHLPASHVASALWRDAIGPSQAQADTQQPRARMDYRHLEALNAVQEELSTQVKQLLQQLSAGLQSIRRAGAGACYTPPGPSDLPFHTSASQAEAMAPSLSVAAPQTAVEARPPPPRDKV